MNNDYILQMKKVVKQFPGVLALDNVDLELAMGEVLALIGENGAGKSTLMKILSGALRMDRGEILLNGETIPPETIPKERIDLGIAIIYQELNYLNEMTIAENLFIGRVPVKGVLKRVDYQRMHDETKELLCRFNLNYDPFAFVKDLGIAEKQMIEILRAVSRDVNVLIMDEPTSSLNEVETRKLFDFIDELKRKGVSIVFISHKLEEVFTIADRVMVMRDGRRVGIKNTSETNNSELVELMVGRTIVDMYPKQDSKIGDEILRVENLSCQIARNISFTLKKGEILGLYGLVGSGCVETVEGLIGKRVIQSGRIFVEGEEIVVANPIAAKKQGIAYIPSDRKAEGLVLIHSVKDNLTLTQIDEIGKGGRINIRKEKEYSDTWIKKMGIKTASGNTEISMLSGGNQQKVVIAKWLLTNPRILIMNDPTRGIDVGAKVEIYKVMEELCMEGFSIIMVSSELPETMGISDRMVILADGNIVGEYERKDYDQNEILHMAVKGKEDERKISCAE